MALTLSISDNTDATGVVATISGSASGTVTLWRSVWDGTMQAYAWTSSGTRSGDGTIAVSITTPAYYVWIASEGSTFSNLYYQNVTDAATTAIHESCVTAARTRILSLSLSGIASTTVYPQWVPRCWDKVETTPCVLLAKIGQETKPGGQLANRMDLGFPIVCCFIDNQQGLINTNANRDLLWRQKVTRAFEGQRLPGIDTSGITSQWCEVESGPIVDEDALLNKSRVVSTIIIRCIVRMTRGLT